MTLLQRSRELPGAHQGNAARRLAELQARAENWGAAAKELAVAIEFENDSREKAALLASLGRLSRDRVGNQEYARGCFERSLELRPDDPKTLESLIRLLESLADYEALERFLVIAIARASAPAERFALTLKHAETLWALRRTPETIAAFETIIQQKPDCAEARSALARLYVEIGNGPKALAFHRELLNRQPLEVNSYRALAEVFRGTGQADAYLQALQAVVTLRTASPDEFELIGAATQAPPSFLEKVTLQHFFTYLLETGVPASLARILSLTTDWYPSIAPVDLKPYDLKRKHKVDLDGDDFEHHQLVSRIVRLFGLEERIDIYWMPHWRRPEVVLEPTPTATLMLCPPVFEGLSAPQAAFLLGRALGPVLVGGPLVAKLGANELVRYLSAIARVIDPDLDQINASGEFEIKKTTKRLLREAKSGTVRRIEPLIRELWGRRDAIQFNEVRLSYELTACRCGVLAAGGAWPAVDSLFKTNVVLGGRLGTDTKQVLEQLGENRQLLEILRYAVSEPYLELRDQLGISPNQQA